MVAVRLERARVKPLQTATFGVRMSLSSALLLYFRPPPFECRTSSQTVYNMCTETCSAQPCAPNPWWRVDLGASRSISNVKVWGRTDCCVNRINGFQVFVSDVDDPNVALKSPPCVNSYIAIGDPPAVVDMTVSANAGRCSFARYVWIMLPGTGEILTLCEVEVNGKLPWVWRQLSGIAEVAQGKPAIGSSSEIGFSSGDAGRAVDGFTSQNNYFDGSCSHTIENRNHPDEAPWWRVDLLDTYDVTSIVVWPRTDCCIVAPDDRTTRWSIAIGNSMDTAFDSPVPGVPAQLGGSVIGAQRSVTIPLATPLTGRFVIVSRSFVMNDINVLSICEIKVYAQLLSGQPAPRTNAAAVGYSGTMIIFGGIDSNGFLLNDVRVFDATNIAWQPLVAPLGQPPAARSGAAFLVLGTVLGPSTPTNGFMLFGGAAASGALGDLYKYSAAPCRSLNFSGAILAPTGHSGTYQPYTCPANYVSTNAGTPMVCDATTGIWQGLYNLATGLVCLPPPPAASTVAITNVVATDSTSALVSYTVANGITYPYVVVSAVPYAVYDADFSTSLGPADWTKRWIFNDALNSGRYSFPKNSLRIEAALSSDCVGTTNNCPTVSRAFPTDYGISASDFYFEAWVAFDPNMLQLQQFTGIGLMLNDTNGGPPTLSLYAGILVGGTSPSTSTYSTVMSTVTGACYSSLSFSYQLTGVYARIERIADPSGAPGTAKFRAAFRATLTESWVYLAGTCPESALPDGQLPPKLTRVGGVARNPNAAYVGAAVIQYMRVSSRSCQVPGTTRLATSSPVTITGLTPGGTYNFTVAAATAAQVGPTTTPAFQTTLPTPAPTPTLSMTGSSVAAGRPTQMTGYYSTTSTQTNYFSYEGVDGNTDQV